MRKLFSLFLFMTIGFFVSLNAQSNIVIKIKKTYSGVKNELIWLIPAGQTHKGPDAIKSIVTPTEDADYYIYTMTSPSNMTKLTKFLNAKPDNKYRVYYHSTDVTTITTYSPAEVGHFYSSCRNCDVIHVVAVDENCAQNQENNIVIKIKKTYAGVKNEKIWLIPAGQTYTGPDVIKSMVTPTEDADYYIYTMTSPSNMTTLTNFMNANPIRIYRVYYHSTDVTTITTSSPADIGHFKKACRNCNLIMVAAVGQSACP